MVLWTRGSAAARYFPPREIWATGRDPQTPARYQAQINFAQSSTRGEAREQKSMPASAAAITNRREL
jgi:hypothetical protein